MNLLSIVVALSLLLLTSGLIAESTAGSICPNKCLCVWRNGKQHVGCERLELISIPSGIESSTQVLNLNRNNFQVLPAKVFQERGLINLQKIWLSGCKLGVIAENAFLQLTNLVELDLSVNFLTAVPSDALKHSPNVRRLILDNNPIATIRKETFAATPHLNYLDLSDCQIGSVEDGAFKGLASLQYLKLDGNRLTTLSLLVVQDLPHLYSMDLHKNPWNCDCQLRPARDWMLRYNVPQSIPPTCAAPEKRAGMMWNSLELDEFACSPQILSRDTEITATIASNASFTCITRAQPEAKVSWLIEDVIYRNLSSSTLSPLGLRGDRFSFTEDRSSGPSVVSSTLTIANLEASDSGKTFVCYAENFAGVASKSFTISVLSLSGTVVGGWSKVETAVAIVTAVVVLLSLFIAITIFILRSRRFKDCNSTTGSTSKTTPVVHHASDCNSSSKASIPQIDVLKNIPSHGTPSPLGSKEILETNGQINFSNFASSLHHYNSRDDILAVDGHMHHHHPHGQHSHLTYGNNGVVDFGQVVDPVTGFLQHQHLMQQQHQHQLHPDHQLEPQQTELSPSQQMFSSMMNGDAMHHSALMFQQQNNGSLMNPPTSSSSNGSHYEPGVFAASMSIMPGDGVPDSSIPVSGTCVICEQAFADLRFHYMDYHQVRECIV